jgi:hypothetical protein
MTSPATYTAVSRIPRTARKASVLAALPNAMELFDGPPVARYLPTAPQQQRQEPPGQGMGVLSLGEAAARLGMSRAELETTIVAGKIEALPTGFTRMIPTTEVERLKRSHS